MNLAAITYFFLAGFGMYLLVTRLKKEPKYAFISSLVYMFNGFMHSFILGGHLNILESYALMPFVYLFVYKAVKDENWAINSAIAGLFFSMMVLAGGMIFFLYTGLLVGSFLLFSLIGKKFLKRLLKISLITAVLLLTLFGVSSIKLLPTLEFTGISNRAAGVSYAEYLGYPIKLTNLWHIAASDLGFNELSGAVGIAAFILLLMSLFSYRNKTAIFFLFLIVVSILLASGSFLSEIFYKTAPGFNKLRHVERALVLFVFSASVLIAYGYANLNAKLSRLGKYNKFKNTIYLLVIILVSVELVLLQKIPPSKEVVKGEDIPLLNHISKDKDLFRTINLGLREFIGAAGYNYNSQLGIPEVKGGGGIWVNDYVAYLSIAQQYNPSKLLGILNTKYIISDRELGIPNINFIQEFPDCKGCDVPNAFGPYLYENSEFLPRAYIVNNSILVIGNEDASRQLAYSLMLGNFNPENTVIILGKEKVYEHSTNFLRKFKAVVLTLDSIDQNSLLILKEYADSGGTLLPDIFNGKNIISNDELDDVFNKLKGNYSAINITEYSNNEITLDLKGKKGFLVLSERYAYFQGWDVFADGEKEEMLKADNIITAMYVDGTKSRAIFKYNSKSFRNGAIITIISILILTFSFSITYLKKKRK